MKTFVPEGRQFEIVKASFMAPKTIPGVVTANKRYELQDAVHGVHRDYAGFVIGYFLTDSQNIREFLGSVGGERVPVRIEDQIDLHKIQKRRLRYRHMMIKGFKRAFRAYGWNDSKVNSFGFSNRRNPRFKDNQYQCHSLADYARMNADPYFDRSGEMFECYRYVHESEMTQSYFDDMAMEEISNW